MSEMERRIAFTLVALLVYRLGTFIPLPGIDITVWTRVLDTQTDGLLSLAAMTSGGAVRRLAIFALGILPYVTAAILMQFASAGSSRLRTLAASDDGRDKIVAYTAYLTVLLAAFQAYGIALGLENVPGLVHAPGLLFRLSTVLTLTAGTLVLVWLSRQITKRGVGNGISLIILSGIVAQLPSVVAGTLELGRQGALSTGLILAVVLMAVAVIAFIVFIEGARRLIDVEYPRREVGGRVVESRSAPLLLKLNNAGLIPTVMAGWLIALVAVIVIFVAGARSPLVLQLSHGHPVFIALFGVLIVVFALFYAAFLLDPDKTSETLARYGGVVRGVATGEATAAYLDNVLTRVTFIGAVYLALVFVVPELLIAYYGLPFYLGGASFLVVVCAALDVSAQFKQEAQLRFGG